MLIITDMVEKIFGNNKTEEDCNNMDILKKFHKELYVGGYPKKTMDAYLYHIKGFLIWVRKPVKQVNQDDIKSYIIYLRGKGLTHSTINLKIQSIKSFFVRFLKRRFNNIKSMKKQEKHTHIFTKDIILKAIKETENVKHKLLLTLLYGSGLRISEALNLVLTDINVDEGMAVIRQGKGQRDREVMISNNFIKNLEMYLFLFNPRKYLFEGRNGKLTVRSGQKIIESIFKKISNKHAHPHMLRASFATHLFEEGKTDRIISIYTGHKDTKSLNPYLNYAEFRKNRIKSPLDT